METLYLSTLESKETSTCLSIRFISSFILRERTKWNTLIASLIMVETQSSKNPSLAQEPLPSNPSPTSKQIANQRKAKVKVIFHQTAKWVKTLKIEASWPPICILLTRWHQPNKAIKARREWEAPRTPDQELAASQRRNWKPKYKLQWKANITKTAITFWASTKDKLKHLKIL